jgi:uncharacterized membrane protein
VVAHDARARGDRGKRGASSSHHRGLAPALLPVVAAGIVGVVVGATSSLLVAWQAAPLIGWSSAACVYLGWVWLTISRLDSAATSRLATREDPSVPVADLVILVAGLASLGAMGLVLVKAAGSHGTTKASLIALGVLSVALSWASVHTVFTLRYARAFYGPGKGEGIDFHNDEPPDYGDFAYVAFTIGLTFQVSDTDINSKHIRRLALRHALLSFLFGAIIVGLTINVVASLLH